MVLSTILTIIFVIVSLFSVAFIIWRSRVIKRAELSRSIGLGLLSVRLPRVEENKEGESTSHLREQIGRMEQVLLQLSAIKERGWRAKLLSQPFFVFELAVPAVGKEATFYLAVPRRYLNAVEKAVQGVYPEAHVERTEDYTLFHQGTSVAILSATAKSSYLPLRTYMSLEVDSVAPILNAFAKIDHEGQSLCLQVVCQKASSHWNKRLSKVATHLRDGKKMDHAIREAGKGKAVKLFEELKNKKDSEKKDKTQSPDQDLVTSFSHKAEKTLFAVSLRIAASAQTKEEAESLAKTLTTPFAQFTDERTNQISFKEKHGRDFRKSVYQFSFRLPDRKPSLVLSTEEIASFFHFPNTSLGAPHLAVEKAKSAPAPSVLPKEGLLLGENIYRDVKTPIFMTENDRARHLYIIGQTGTGKSYFMRNLIIQDIRAGKGVCVIDPHGELTEGLLNYIPKERLEDVIYFDPGDVERPMGLNMLEHDPRFPEQKTFVVNELLSIFNKLFDMKVAGGPAFEQYFRNSALLVMEDPASGNTLLEISRVMSDKPFRDLKLSHCQNPLISQFWANAERTTGEQSLANFVPYITNKFDAFLSNDIMRPIVVQEKSAFNFREVMDSGKILLVNLSKGRLGELNSSLIGLIIVGKILAAAFSRVNVPEESRRPFSFYIDEFQNVTTDSISTILSEARKYRLSLTLAHQYIGQLSEEIKKSVFGNVGSHVAFRVGAEDGEFLDSVKQFAPVFSARDLINIDNYNCYIKMLINGQTAQPFSMKVPPAPIGDDSISYAVKEYSRLTYGRDRKEVEEEIKGKFSKLERKG